jgi:hypothetical protein
MITKLTLRNFKSVSEQTYDFTQFDLLVEQIAVSMAAGEIHDDVHQFIGKLVSLTGTHPA